MVNLLAIIVAGLALSAAVDAQQPGQRAAEAEAARVQSILLRSVTVTCKLDDSIAFYRDVLGQEVIEDVRQNGAGAAKYLDVSPNAEVRFVVMKGSAVYPGGEIIGGRVAFMGINDPDGKACKDQDATANRKGVHGSHIHPHRVANIDEIARRAKAKGVEILFGPGPSGSRMSRSMMMFDPNGRIVEVFEINIARIPD
ncbi:MAG: VOC family protein [Rhodospirillaceae bacterium]|nr:VOC family protein [Rhodospirillaceae bacterium]